MPVETIDLVSRYLYAFLLLMVALAALGWVRSEAGFRRNRLRMLPSAGTIGELMVLQGSRDLPPQTWFPVSHEGVLGSVRSCDLVIPCPGVKSRHLDYVWQDGVGLLVRPRSGCEIWVNGILLDCRSDAAAFPLTNGSVLQIGQAVLRLNVLKAFDHTSSPVSTVLDNEPIGVPECPSREDPYSVLRPEVPFQASAAPWPFPAGYTPPSREFIPEDSIDPEPLNKPSAGLPEREPCQPVYPECDSFSGNPGSDKEEIPSPISPRGSIPWKEDWGE